MATRLPPLLQPYLAPPPANSLVLLTSVLGASTNWLVLRWICSLLEGGRGNEVPELGTLETEMGSETTVVLCSFFREGGFWREGAGRMALNLNNDRFIFVDGLTALCMPDTQLPEGKLPARDILLRGTAVQDVRKGLESAIAQATSRSGRVVLVLDQMDAWLAMAEAREVEVMDLLLSLREKVHSTIVTVSADDPLLHAQATTLEKEHAAFALSLAHEAYRVMALRLLDTGSAVDVSGVVRITGGGKGNGGMADAEYLYYVSGDGGVKVFERGA
ncbi:hypothetical protein E4U60_003905 [Claviceps pazoutovae]|uniref:Elongator complex protein 6 n=1 Tax=Claviceps pazoutovae TaxID=1649127 RepID=A0A9P7M9L6_9HYPO|nr:hypothetical protein E4U60_003905 [Claviceps pazoutovae]